MNQFSFDRPFSYPDGVSIDAMYGPWDNVSGLVTMVQNDFGFDAPKDGTEFAIKSANGVKVYVWDSKVTPDANGYTYKEIGGGASAEQLAAKQDKLSEEQLLSVNSGITKPKISTYDGYASSISNLQTGLNAKQANLNDTQMSAVNSGVTSTKVGEYDSHKASTSNPHRVTKAQVGLGNVDNTSDADKPISTAVSRALQGKQSTLSPEQMNAVNSGITQTKVSQYDGMSVQVTSAQASANAAESSASIAESHASSAESKLTEISSKIEEFRGTSDIDAATILELAALSADVEEIGHDEDNDGRFKVVDEEGNIGFIVDNDGAKARTFSLVSESGSTEKSIDKEYLVGIENSISAKASKAYVDEKIPDIDAEENNSGKFEVADEQGRRAVIADGDGVRSVSFRVVDEYNTELFVWDKNTIARDIRTELRLLILGDSYSQGGHWVNGLTDCLKFKSIVNLGVGSATVKDKYSDRTLYPYTSRPVQSSSNGNLNTLSCQIEKLKRLMAGVDLDDGEEQIYKTSDEYPNIVIIEGGQNDSADSDSVENTYVSQFVKMVSNVYVKQNSSTGTSLGSCLIQTPSDEVDRTCFAGAYRYLSEQIRTLFPDAQIFITSRSNLSYWNGNYLADAMKMVEQQKKCSYLASMSFIDWMMDGQISSVNNHVSGSGTANDPYVWADSPNMPDTGDLMHPNARGGKKYGQVAANAIISKLITL